MVDINDNRNRGSGLIVDRRELLTGAAALGLGLGMPGAMAAETAKKGGTLEARYGRRQRFRQPRPPYLRGFYSRSPTAGSSGTASLKSTRKAIPSGELAESWEAKPGATSLDFQPIRKGITFGSGKTMDADDVIYSLPQLASRRHEVRREGSDVLSQRHQEAER